MHALGIAEYSVSLTAMMIAGGGVAFAQDVPATGGRDFGIEEIVVTAQKREQNVQDVPIAVTAVSQESLQVNRVQNITDLNGLAPGLMVHNNAGSLGSPAFSMRGVFATASQPSSDRQISTYIDGVYIGATRGAVFDLPDIQRIEVLRGPQGTLFGRNATAGAVSVVTRDPTGEFHLRQETTVGNYDQFRTRTTVDIPSVGPFSAYVTYVHDERRGDVRNLGYGTAFDRTSPFTNIGRTTSPKYLGGKNSENVFAALRFAPSDDFSMVYKFDRSSTRTTPEARGTTVINPNSFVGGVLLGILAAQPVGGGIYGPIPLHPSEKRPKATNNAFTQPGFLTASGHSLTTRFEASDSVSLRNISAYRKSTAYGPTTIMGLSGLEYTPAAKAFYTAPRAFLGGASYAQALGADGNAPIGSYFAGYEGNSYGRGWQVSSETQLNYESELLTLTVGALYYHSFELSSGLPGMAPNFAFMPIPSLLPLGNVQEARSKATSLAAYTQGEIHITPKLDLVLGGRVTKDKKVVTFTTGGTLVGTRTDGTLVGKITTPGEFKKTKPTYAVGVNYKATDDILVYGKYSTAFLSGGAVANFTFQPETVSSWELGLKSEFFDRRLRVNLALYDAKYLHTQSSQSGQNVVGAEKFGVVVIDNGPLKARGAELEIVAAPVRGVSLGGSVGYTDSKLTAPNVLGTQGRPTGQSGMPKWIGTLNGQYVTQSMIGDATLLFRLDGNYQGKFRAIIFKDLATAAPVFAPYEFSPARWIVNGRVALRDIDMQGAKGEVALWARNLLDNKDTTSPLPFGDIQLDSGYQPARTWGVDVIVNF